MTRCPAAGSSSHRVRRGPVPRRKYSPPEPAAHRGGLRRHAQWRRQRHIDIGKGATSGVSAVEAAGRTRVVVELIRASSYGTRRSGNRLVLTVNNGSSDRPSSPRPAAPIRPRRCRRVEGLEISNIDFRRGNNGEGRVVVSFQRPRRRGEPDARGRPRSSLDLSNVNLPPNLAQRLDMLDFATPGAVDRDPRRRHGGVRIEIAAKPPFEQLAYQTGNEYVVEVAPKKDDAKLKRQERASRATAAAASPSTSRTSRRARCCS